MTATVNYRLINRAEHLFIVETLILTVIGFGLILLFTTVFFKALSATTNSLAFPSASSQATLAM